MYAFAALRLPPIGARDKGVETLALRHQITVPHRHRDLTRQRHARICRPKRPRRRPSTVHSIRAHILRLVRENPGWGYRQAHHARYQGRAVHGVEILEQAGLDPAPERASRRLPALAHRHPPGLRLHRDHHPGRATPVHPGHHRARHRTRPRARHHRAPDRRSPRRSGTSYRLPSARPCTTHPGDRHGLSDPRSRISFSSSARTTRITAAASPVRATSRPSPPRCTSRRPGRPACACRSDRPPPAYRSCLRSHCPSGPGRCRRPRQA